MKAWIFVLIAGSILGHFANATEIMVCTQQELKINKNGLGIKKSDSGKKVYLVDGKVSTIVEATKAAMADSERK